MDSELEELRLELHAMDLYDEHYALLEKMAKRYAVNKDNQTEIDTLIHMGWLGIRLADFYYNKDCGVSFVSYAIPHIRRFMKIYLQTRK